MSKYHIPDGYMKVIDPPQELIKRIDRVIDDGMVVGGPNASEVDTKIYVEKNISSIESATNIFDEWAGEVIVLASGPCRDASGPDFEIDIEVKTARSHDCSGSDHEMSKKALKCSVCGVRTEDYVQNRGKTYCSNECLYEKSK